MSSAPVIKKNKTKPSLNHPCHFHFRSSALSVCSVHAIRARMSSHLLLPWATTWNKVHFQIQSQTKWKGQKIMKEKAGYSHEYGPPCRSFYCSHQMGAGRICSCVQLPGLWPWSRATVNQRKSREWPLAASCRQPCTLLNAAENGSAPLSLITVAIPGALQQHSGNHLPFMSDTKFRMEGSRRKWWHFLRASMPIS